MPYKHITVFPDQAVEYLSPMPGKVYVDCTMGGAGHSKRILKRISPGGTFIGIDQDLDAIDNARKGLDYHDCNIHLIHDNFVNLSDILCELHISSVDGILLDLGLSLNQLKNSKRGFSFSIDEPLDMRFNINTKVTAEDVVNKEDKKSLAKIFRQFGEERFAVQIANNIVRYRKKKPVLTTKQLVEIVYESVPTRIIYKQKIHPATRIFMALRIFVNKELEMLDKFMKNAAGVLNSKGRICVISFHSLEDRIVKHSFKEFAKECVCPPDFPRCICNKKKSYHVLSKKAIRPQKNEIEANPMARSAILRVAEKV